MVADDRLSRDADVIVVGGRVAGALTAAHLSALEMRVVVLEAGSFPSDTISTHFFRGDGLVRSLQEIWVLDEVLATGAPRYFRELSHQGLDTVVEPPQEPGDVGFGLSVRRVTLDAILASWVASLPGVELRVRTRVEGLVSDNDAVVGVRLTGGETLTAPVVVGADGRRSSVARWVGAKPVESHESARVIYFQYVVDWTSPNGGAPDAPEFSLRGNELAYVFPSDGGVACVALSLPAADWTTTRDRRSTQFAERLAAHPALWPRLQATSPRGGLISAPAAASSILPAAGPGWALVGDAGTHQDPWSGLGMDTAARQARALANSLAGATANWSTICTQARDAVTVERFHETVHGAHDLTQL